MRPWHRQQLGKSASRRRWNAEMEWGWGGCVDVCVCARAEMECGATEKRRVGEQGWVRLGGAR